MRPRAPAGTRVRLSHGDRRSTDHLRLLFARIGHRTAPRAARRDRSPERAADRGPDLRPAGGDAAARARAGTQSRTARPRATRVFDPDPPAGLRRVRVDGEQSETRRDAAAGQVQAPHHRGHSRLGSSCGMARSRTTLRPSLRPARRLPDRRRDTQERSGRRDSTRLAELRRDGPGRAWAREWFLIAPAPRDGEAPEFGERRLQRALQLSVRRHHGGPSSSRAALQLQLAPRRLVPPAPASAAASRSTRSASCSEQEPLSGGRRARALGSTADGELLARQDHRGGLAASTAGTTPPPVKNLPPEALDYILYSGRGERVVIGYRHERGENTYGATFGGIIPNLERRYRETESDFIKSELEALHGRPTRAPRARAGA